MAEHARSLDSDAAELLRRLREQAARVAGGLEADRAALAAGSASPRPEADLAEGRAVLAAAAAAARALSTAAERGAGDAPEMPRSDGTGLDSPSGRPQN